MGTAIFPLRIFEFVSQQYTFAFSYNFLSIHFNLLLIRKYSMYINYWGGSLHLAKLTDKFIIFLGMFNYNNFFYEFALKV
jgi:hypothetical protein